MRWEALFADMEAQLAADERAGIRADVAELVRAERASVRICDRLRDAVGSVVRLQLAGGDVLEGEVRDAAEQWILLAPTGGQRVLVPTTAVAAVAGLGRQVAPEAGPVERRLGLGHALRAVARDRAAVGVRAGDVDLFGRVDVVGADHLDVTVAGPGRAGVSWSVPFDALRWVRSS